EHDLHDRVGGREAGHLGQMGQAGTAHALDRARVRRDLAGDQAKHGALPGAVPTDEGDLLALLDPQVHVLENGVPRKGFSNAIETYEAHDSRSTFRAPFLFRRERPILPRAPLRAETSGAATRPPGKAFPIGRRTRIPSGPCGYEGFGRAFEGAPGP